MFFLSLDHPKTGDMFKSTNESPNSIKKSKGYAFRGKSSIKSIIFSSRCPNNLDMQFAIGTVSLGISLFMRLRKAKMGLGQIFFSSRGASDAFLSKP